MKKLLFAINPHAGKGEIKTKALEVIDLFVHDGYEVTVHTTQRRREITHLLAGRAALYDLIVCCGGDGTLNETIDGLMRCAASAAWLYPGGNRQRLRFKPWDLQKYFTGGAYHFARRALCL